MVLALRRTNLAVRTGRLGKNDADRLRQLLRGYGLPDSIPPALNRQRIKGYLKSDKKTIGGRVFFVLPTEIGKVIITDQVAAEDIDAVLG